MHRFAHLRFLRTPRGRPLAFALRLAAGFALVLIGSAARADDCPQCSVKAVCGPHAEADKAAVEAFKAAWKDKDSERRVSALDALAAANDAHANARSKATAAAMTAALKDPAPEVRNLAARLLGKTQDTPTALKALGAEADTALKRFAKVDLKKERGTPDYQRDMKALRAVYDGLGATKSREAAPYFARGLEMLNAEIIEAAAANCGQLKLRVIMDGLILAQSRLAKANVSVESSSAWLVVNQLLPKLTGHTGIAPQKDGDDAPRFALDWESWWKENKRDKAFE